MSPARIRDRPNTDGSVSFQVIFRRGGRGFPLEHAGTFRGWPSGKAKDGSPRPSISGAEREAKLRRDLVGGWLAAGLDPRTELRKLLTPRERRTTYENGCAWLGSRVDLADRTKDRVYKAAVDRLDGSRLGRLDPSEATWTDVQEWLGEQRHERTGEPLTPKSLKTYMSAVKQAFDYADVNPNPARDRRIRLAVTDVEEYEPPDSEHVLAMLGLIPFPLRKPFALIEQCGMRVSEPSWYEWRDVDVANSRLRVRSEVAKGRRGRRRARWVQVPEWLMGLALAETPPDDRTAERRVFVGYNAEKLRDAMERACRAAGLPHYSPKDLRHRRISLWHGQGIPWRAIADRVGQSRPSITIDVYSHVMPLEEVPVDAYKRLLVRAVKNTASASVEGEEERT